MLLLKCLVVALIASSAAQSRCGLKGSSTGLIVGGTRSGKNEWPWLTALIDIPTQKFFCGATIISEKHVITAAHCVQPKSSSTVKRADEVVAFLGKHNVTLAYERDVEAFYPTEVLVHPDWNVFSDRFDADLAILRSESSIRFTRKISPACLWNSDDENVEGIVAGWGSSENSNQMGYEALPRQIKVRRVPSQKCYEDYHPFAAISSVRTFCGAGSIDNSGPCSGDSGGGFFTSINNVWYLNGIVSASFVTSEGFCDVTKYALFTKPSEFKDWINDKIKSSVIHPAACTESVIKRKACSRIDNLYDNQAGSRPYLKSLCTIAGRVTFNEAQRQCNDAGMKLVSITSTAERTAFIDVIAAQFVAFNASVGWVGELQPNPKWSAFDSQEAALFNDLLRGKNVGCLVVKKSSVDERQHFSTKNCSKTHWTHCEFMDDLLK